MAMKTEATVEVSGERARWFAFHFLLHHQEFEKNKKCLTFGTFSHMKK